MSAEKINESINYYELSYQVMGIKKRCRKSDRHFFHLGKVDLDFDKSHVESVIRSHVQENMKTVSSMVRIHLDYITTSQDGFFEQWQPFSGKNIAFNLSL